MSSRGTTNTFAAFFSNCMSLRPCLPRLGTLTSIPPYGFYSPGLQCPSGWTSFEAPTSQIPATLYPDEEVVLCCPRLYLYSTVQLTPWGTLTTSLPRFCAYQVAAISGDGLRPFQYMSCEDWSTSDTSRLALASSQLLVLAPAVQLNRRPRDALSYNTLKSSSLRASITSTTTTSPTFTSPILLPSPPATNPSPTSTSSPQSLPSLPRPRVTPPTSPSSPSAQFSALSSSSPSSSF
ncbi:hypothetical protein GE09DRAFT_361558 [Coniochaeta sp. 2T2.1]|nr:hypothetical protein GE09DRAFT_361558 [Coniochaeta sp. 2T2.1]